MSDERADRPDLAGSPLGVEVVRHPSFRSGPLSKFDCCSMQHVCVRCWKHLDEIQRESSDKDWKRADQWYFSTCLDQFLAYLRLHAWRPTRPRNAGQIGQNSTERRWRSRRQSVCWTLLVSLAYSRPFSRGSPPAAPSRDWWWPHSWSWQNCCWCLSWWCNGRFPFCPWQFEPDLRPRWIPTARACLAWAPKTVRRLDRTGGSRVILWNLPRMSSFLGFDWAVWLTDRLGKCTWRSDDSVRWCRPWRAMWSGCRRSADFWGRWRSSWPKMLAASRQEAFERGSNPLDDIIGPGRTQWPSCQSGRSSESKTVRFWQFMAIEVFLPSWMSCRSEVTTRPSDTGGDIARAVPPSCRRKWWPRTWRGRRPASGAVLWQPSSRIPDRCWSNGCGVRQVPKSSPRCQNSGFWTDFDWFLQRCFLPWRSLLLL